MSLESDDVIENYEIDSEIEPTQSLSTRLRDQAYFLLSIVGLFYLLEFLDLLTGQSLEIWGGIQPRQINGLLGIPLAPFLHGNWAHLFANTIPFVVLGGLVILSSNRQQFIGVSCIIAGIAGTGTWLFANGGYHIGASSLIFGYLGFLLWRAWLGRNLAWTIIALLAGILYGSIIISLFRSQGGVSWSGHAFGLTGGIIAAFVFTPKPKSI